VLSGDTSLLEKAKLDKKIAVLENLKTVHYREQSNNKNLLASKKEKKDFIDAVVKDLDRDYELYTSKLQHDEDGKKINELTIPALSQVLVEREAKVLSEELKKQERQLLRSLGMKVGTKEKVEIKEEARIIGEYLIKLHDDWRPKPGTPNELVGYLCGFNCYIERVGANIDQVEELEKNSAQGYQIITHNKFYVQHPEGGLKYTFNHGVPHRENPTIAARHFLNAIDKCTTVIHGKKQEQRALNVDIEHLEKMEYKLFPREEELSQMKEEANRLAAEIKIKLEASKKEKKDG
jgi:hypothetical protein